MPDLPRVNQAVKTLYGIGTVQGITTDKDGDLLVMVAIDPRSVPADLKKNYRGGPFVVVNFLPSQVMKT